MIRWGGAISLVPIVFKAQRGTYAAVQYTHMWAALARGVWPVQYILLICLGGWVGGGGRGVHLPFIPCGGEGSGTCCAACIQAKPCYAAEGMGL